jgi:hypothetical protein
LRCAKVELLASFDMGGRYQRCGYILGVKITVEIQDVLLLRARRLAKRTGQPLASSGTVSPTGSARYRTSAVQRGTANTANRSCPWPPASAMNAICVALTAKLVISWRGADTTCRGVPVAESSNTPSIVEQ